jgi:hypothetical protein
MSFLNAQLSDFDTPLVRNDAIFAAAVQSFF